MLTYWSSEPFVKYKQLWVVGIWASKSIQIMFTVWEQLSSSRKKSRGEEVKQLTFEHLQYINVAQNILFIKGFSKLQTLIWIIGGQQTQTYMYIWKFESCRPTVSSDLILPSQQNYKRWVMFMHSSAGRFKWINTCRRTGVKHIVACLSLQA